MLGAVKSTSTDKTAIAELFLPFHSSFLKNHPIPWILSDHPTMATTASFLSLLLLSLLAASAVARPGLPFHPCKTLLISTYTVSEVRPDFFTVVAEFHEFHPRPLEFPENPQFRPLRHPRAFFPADDDRQTLIHRPEFSLGSSSLRDRTVDILSVLASLLFGAACGALTAATMYLVWSLFNCRLVAYRSLDGFSSDDDDDDDDIFNPKKVHYSKINTPAAPSPAASVETALLKKESV